MKIFKRKHFQALIYSIFLSLPLFSVLGRCVYTIANKNAYQSYSGLTDNTETNVFVNTTQNFDYERTYYITNSSLDTSASALSSSYVYFDILEVQVNQSASSKDLSDVVRCYFYMNGNTIYYNFYDTNNNNITMYSTESFKLKVNITNFQVGNASQNSALEFALAHSTLLYYVNYHTETTLDNAFEYSIDRFVSENDYGELDFFTWFSSLFLSGNSLDSLYIHFINWYMNYILYVSLGYLIFSVLLWFVNFFRRLVDDTQNINVGGM